MKALLCNAVGSIDEAAVSDVPEPTLRTREALVRIHACGLNFPDILMLQGKYQRKPPLPFSPGCEFSGIVESVGADVPEFEPGDRVCGMVGYGALAEKLAVSADNLTLLPQSVDMDEAAALLFTYGTSLYALRGGGGVG
jgi:NADPH2:quinone reductase